MDIKSFLVGLGVQNGKIKSSIVLAGDPKQLEAVVNSKHAIKLGCKKSFMAYLFEKPRYQRNEVTGKYDSTYIVQLTKNYRSHSDILRIPNDLFYGGRLEAKASAG